MIERKKKTIFRAHHNLQLGIAVQLTDGRSGIDIVT